MFSSFSVKYFKLTDCSTKENDIANAEAPPTNSSEQILNSALPSKKNCFIDTNNLAGLRGIATLHILISNYVGFISDVDLFGGVSVSLFLILSSFILTVVYGQRVQGMNSSAEILTFSKEFYVKRFARIIPICYLSIIFSLAIGIVSKSRIQFVLTWFYLTSWVGLAPFNYPLWTVSTILFYYMCFPYMLQYIGKVRNRQQFSIIMYVASIAAAIILYGIYLVILSIPIAIPLADVTDPFFFARSFPLGRLPLFAMGMAIAFERLQLTLLAPFKLTVPTPMELTLLAPVELSHSSSAMELSQSAPDSTTEEKGSEPEPVPSRCLCQFLPGVTKKYSQSQLSDLILGTLTLAVLLGILIAAETTLTVWFALRFVLEFFSPIVFAVWMFVLTDYSTDSDLDKSFFVNRVLKSSFLRAVSDRSLSIYVMHYPIAQYFFMIRSGTASLANDKMLHPVWSIFPPLVFTFLCAWAMTDIVEIPLRDAIVNYFLVKPNKLPPTKVIAMMA